MVIGAVDTRPAASPSELAELAALDAIFEVVQPVDILRWAAARFGAGLVATASFADALLVSVVAQAAPQTAIVLLDTQYLFAETLWFADELRRRFDLNLHVVAPAPEVQPDNLWQTDTTACCALRKVEPLNRALAGRTAWVTGLRRADSAERADAPIVSWDAKRQLVKINPLATWSDESVAAWEATHDLPKNPLTDRGYPSIGCWPCTRPVAEGEDPRSGRWAGQEKTECGLHL